jgi:hypothetical protein
VLSNALSTVYWKKSPAVPATVSGEQGFHALMHVSVATGFTFQVIYLKQGAGKAETAQ